MADVNDFFTLESMLTLTGATGATVVISNSLQIVLNKSPRWLALAVAQFISLGTLFFSKGAIASDYFIAFINGFLVYSTAVGASVFTNGAPAGGNMQARGAEEATAPVATSSPKRTFFSSWF